MRLSDSSCPVDYTCSSIDLCIEELKKCMALLSEVEVAIHTEDHKKALDNLHDVRFMLESYVSPVYSPLENLRKDNAKLREWGLKLEANNKK